MEYGKFILSGEDKKALSSIKNALTAAGHIFIGYVKEYHSIIRHVRSSNPDLVIIDAGNGLLELKQNITLLDEEMACACVLILEKRDDEVIEFLRRSRVVSYLTKPVFDEAVLQVVDLALLNYQRVMEYEEKVRKLNETLESRKAVEKAKWILVEKEGFTEAEAYETLKRKSRDNRIPMREIAEAIILTRG